MVPRMNNTNIYFVFKNPFSLLIVDRHLFNKEPKKIKLIYFQCYSCMFNITMIDLTNSDSNHVFLVQ